MEVKWIKLSIDIFSNRKIRMISKMTDGDAIIVTWLRLLVMAGELNDGGAVYFTQGKPYTEEQFSLLMDKPRETIALALRTFEAYGMISYDDDKVMHIVNWEKYQSTDKLAEIREQNRERQQRFRDKNRDSNVTDNVSVTLRNATDKNRKEKNRRDKNNILSQAISQWQSNVDAAEANKEIRT